MFRMAEGPKSGLSSRSSVRLWKWAESEKIVREFCRKIKNDETLMVLRYCESCCWVYLFTYMVSDGSEAETKNYGYPKIQ